MNSFAFLTILVATAFFLSSNEAFECVDNTNDDDDGANVFLAKVVRRQHSRRLSPLFRLVKRAIRADDDDGDNDGKCQADEGAFCLNASCEINGEDQTVQMCTDPMPADFTNDDLCAAVISLCEDDLQGSNARCNACTDDDCNE